MNEDTHGLFRFFNIKNAQKYQIFYLATEVEHDQSSYFCRGPDNFCWGPAPVGPTLVTGPVTAAALGFQPLTIHIRSVRLRSPNSALSASVGMWFCK